MKEYKRSVKGVNNMSSPTTNKKQKKMDIYKALINAVDGKRITRLEWNDKRWYCLLENGLLQIHKAGEPSNKLHPWTINDGDLLAKDWIVLPKRLVN